MGTRAVFRCRKVKFNTKLKHRNRFTDFKIDFCKIFKFIYTNTGT
jgi:hypothetical protein